MSKRPLSVADRVAKKRYDAARIEYMAYGKPNRTECKQIRRLRAEADRIEAAAKRERAEVEVSALSVGNSAAMREALEYCREYAMRREIPAMRDRVEHALRTPVRNCDRYRTPDEAWKAWNAWGPKGRPLVKNWDETNAGVFARWLFAPAEEEVRDGK